MTKLPRIAFALTIWLSVTGFASLESLFAPKSELWEHWLAHDPASQARIDHSAWNGLLNSYLKVDTEGVNTFDYGKVSNNDKTQLNAYVNHLTATPVASLNRAEQMAYWINFYNALTVKVVLDHWPVAGIRDIDITPGFLADGPWGKKLVTVDGEMLSLNDIEHRILRPIWKDPRIHYAVNCASNGCPDLAAEAFTADNLEAMLEAGARAYINDARGAAFDNAGDLVVSKIYAWFKDDFGGSDEGVLRHLRQYAEGTKRETLQKAETILGHTYDWNINAPAAP